MGSVGGMLGIAGGGGGTGVSTLNPTPIQTPVATSQAQNSIQQTQNLLAALQAQNGIQNQTDVYNQLQNVAAGRGPNPAQAMLNQATGANTANQAALMAGQRGAAQNTGLIARQAAMQGAANQQRAIGQGATMQANQSLGALGQAGAMANTQANQYTATQLAQQQSLLNAIAAQNQAQVGVNSANAQMAGTRMGQQPGMLGALTQGIGNVAPFVGKLFSSGPASTIAGTAAPELGSEGAAAGNAVGIGDALDAGMEIAAEGGEVGSLPETPDMQTMSSTPTIQAQSSFGRFLAEQSLKEGQEQDKDILNKQATSPIKAAPADAAGIDTKSLDPGLKFDWDKAGQGALHGAGMGAAAGSFIPGIGTLIGGGIGAIGGGILGGVTKAAEGGKVPALVSPGERYLPPNEVGKVLKGEKSPLQAGEKIPGQPKFPGNDYRNDTVKKDLDQGGFVIPNKILQGPNSHWEAMKFIKKNYKGGSVK